MRENDIRREEWTFTKHGRAMCHREHYKDYRRAAPALKPGAALRHALLPLRKHHSWRCSAIEARLLLSDGI